MRSMPTFYRGIEFRSRLEARWAVFFDSIGVDWRYEPEAFDFGQGVAYLPDFHLPRAGYFVEIKPFRPDAEEIDKCIMLQRRVPHRVRLMFGAIGWWRWQGWNTGPDNGGIGFWRERDGDEWMAQSDETPPLYCPCFCPVCGAFGIEYQGRPARLACRHVESDKMRAGDEKNIVLACEAAAAWQPHIDGAASLAPGLRES